MRKTWQNIRWTSTKFQTTEFDKDGYWFGIDKYGIYQYDGFGDSICRFKLKSWKQPQTS